VCLPLLIFPCTIKSRSYLLAPAHAGGPRKRSVKRLCVYVCVCVCDSVWLELMSLLAVNVRLWKSASYTTYMTCRNPRTWSLRQCGQRSLGKTRRHACCRAREVAASGLFPAARLTTRFSSYHTISLAIFLMTWLDFSSPFLSSIAPCESQDCKWLGNCLSK